MFARPVKKTTGVAWNIKATLGQMGHKEVTPEVGIEVTSELLIRIK